jgi:glycosyltransferase involved in cell wall biosynthesis
LEYGVAGLPTVSTTVGQCPAVLDHGAAGFLATPKCPDELATGMEFFLGSADLRRRFGQAFRQRVSQQYSVQPVTEKLCCLYDRVLTPLQKPA